MKFIKSVVTTSIMSTMLALSACTVTDTQMQQQQQIQKQPVIVFDASKYSNQSEHCPQVTEKNYQSCAVKGGTLQMQGMLGCYGCLIKYADAGKTCRDHSDCQGSCYSVSGADFNAPATGQCSADNSPFGCRQEIVNGKAKSMLCVD